MTQLATLHPLDVLAAESRNGSGINGAKPPVSVRGYVEDSTFQGLLADVLETVADVAWPTSIRTYQQMRNDPKLFALLDGYTLQLRRAQWQLDSTDCRPEVVELVADDMDLPVTGADRHGAARTRGVSWREHLAAGLTMLDYGHMGFEMQADISSGQARLIGLWERPQHTISQIHVEPKTGAFTGISQELDLGPFDKPELKADRLVWYAHRREGAQWFGRSMLRPAFAPWLLKREMQRVLATSSRRFGMGVPTAEFAQTAAPTPQQFSEAQKAASAARVGDQSGLAMPPGAMLRLVGLSGGVPDTLAFIKWLDQQMSTMALMGHLDLGQTQTGSRALGESFIDSWTLALEAIGEEVADVATRQVAARIVQWNWGADEPVPRVTVSGVGSRREITAESLSLLLESGALAADPGLEEWVRREYRLPDRTTPRPAVVQIPGRATAPANETAAAEPAPAQQVEAAAAPPRPVRYEQPELDVVAHLPGKHDQSTHGRRKKAPSVPKPKKGRTRRAPEEKPETPKPAPRDRRTAKPSGMPKPDAGKAVPDPAPVGPPKEPRRSDGSRPSAGKQSKLARSVASGVAKTTKLGGGTAKPELVTFKDGTKAVHKIHQYNFGGVDPVWQTDAEELAGKLARAIGLDAPDVHRGRRRAEIWMEYVDSRGTAGKVLEDHTAPEWSDSDQGRLIGLFDLVVDNADRHQFNWLVTRRNTIVAIDHGLSFRYRDDGRPIGPTTPPAARSAFERHFVTGPRSRDDTPRWSDNDLSPQDIETFRGRLAAMRPEFERLDRPDWFEAANARLDAIGAHAKGTRDRIS